MFAERSEFAFDPARFEVAYDELERSIYQGRCVTEVIAPLLGHRPRSRNDRARAGRRSLDGADNGARRCPNRTRADRAAGPAAGPASCPRSSATPFGFVRAYAFPACADGAAVVRAGRVRDRADRLLAVDDGVWSPVPLGSSGRPRLLTLIPRDSEDELRGFCNLIARRLPAAAGGRPDNSGAGEVGWALSRFEMGCERIVPFEALTDYLLALRALLEPEGPSSGRMAQRLSMICAPPDGRAQLAERTAHAISLERAVIAGLAPAATGVDALVEEIAEHLRAILRDVLCGHLSADIRSVADEMIAEAADLSAAAAV